MPKTLVVNDSWKDWTYEVEAYYRRWGKVELQLLIEQIIENYEINLYTQDQLDWYLETSEEGDRGISYFSESEIEDVYDEGHSDGYRKGYAKGLKESLINE